MNGFNDNDVTDPMVDFEVWIKKRLVLLFFMMILFLYLLLILHLFFLNELLLEEVVAPALLVVAVKAPFPQDEAEAPTQLITSAAQRRRSWCLRHRCR